MTSVVWFRGVPWEPRALESARADDVAEPVTEVARAFIAISEPGSVTKPTAATRGRFTAVVSPELVVIGHGRLEEGSTSASEQPGRAKGRGPRSYAELEAWLAEEGYPVVDKPRSSHRAVLDPRTGATMVTIGQDKPGNIMRSSLKNDIATCRRVLGIALRKEHR